jgi:hypothetical protein
LLALGILDSPRVRLLRLTDERPESVNAYLAPILVERASELESGALMVVEDGRYRVRRLPIRR